MARRAVLAALAFAPVLATAQGGAFQGTVSGSDVSRNTALEGVGIEQKIGVKIPTDVPLTDDKGGKTNFGRLLRGRPLVVLPIFYRCTGVCTTEMQGVLRALSKNRDLVPGRDFDIVALGLNPKETPDLAAAKKTEYLDQDGRKATAPGWTFLTSPEAEAQTIAKAVGFKYTYDAALNRVNHPSAVYILTPSGRVSTLMLQGMYPSARFAEDVRRAAKDELGEPLQETAWLGCVHIDPITGERSIAVQGVLRLAGVATVLGIIGTIVVQNRRKRPKASPAT